MSTADQTTVYTIELTRGAQPVRAVFESALLAERERADKLQAENAAFACVVNAVKDCVWDAHWRGIIVGPASWERIQDAIEKLANLDKSSTAVIKRFSEESDT